MDWGNLIFALLAISQALFLGLFLLIYRRDSRDGQLLVLFCVCLIGYIAVNIPEVVQYSFPLTFVLTRLATALPALLWTIAFRLFTDQTRPASAMIWLILVYWLGRAAGGAFYNLFGAAGEVVFLVTFVFSQAVMLGLSLHAVFIAARGYHHDLVELRRQARVSFVLSMGALLALIVVNGSISTVSVLFSGVELPAPIPEWVFSFSIFSLLLMFQLLIFRPNDSALRIFPAMLQQKNQANRFTAQAKKEELILIDKIRRVMEDNRAYTRHGFTIGELAKLVPAQEYKLRRTINTHMHYNNFNQLLNFYRIKEAAKRLIETDDAISNIGFDVGYSSLSSFHKTFRESIGMTPKEYRIRNTMETHPSADPVAR